MQTGNTHVHVSDIVQEKKQKKLPAEQFLVWVRVPEDGEQTTQLSWSFWAWRRDSVQFWEWESCELAACCSAWSMPPSTSTHIPRHFIFIKPHSAVWNTVKCISAVKVHCYYLAYTSHTLSVTVYGHCVYETAHRISALSLMYALWTQLLD